MKKDDYISVKDFAKALGITPTRVLGMIKEEKITAVRIGCYWIIPKQELSGWKRVQHKSRTWLEREKPQPKLDLTDQSPADLAS